MPRQYQPLTVVLLLDTMPMDRFIVVYNAMLLAGRIRGLPDTRDLTPGQVNGLLENTGIVWG